MAKRISVTKELPPVETLPEIQARPNPDLFGTDVMDAMVIAAGAGASGYLNDMLVTPVLKPAVASAIPGEGYDSVITQIIDGVTTFGVGAALGHVTKMLFGAKAGAQVTLGGAVLGGARLLASLIPGYSLNYSFPSIPGLAGLAGQIQSGVKPLAGPQAPIALQAAGASTAGNVGRLGIGSTGL